jgi:hypothetical protein
MMVLVINFKLLSAYFGCWDNCGNMQGMSNIKILAKFPQQSAGLFSSGICPISAVSLLWILCVFYQQHQPGFIPDDFYLREVSFGSPQSDAFRRMRFLLVLKTSLVYVLPKRSDWATLRNMLELSCSGTLQLINSWNVFHGFPPSNLFRPKRWMIFFLRIARG